MKANFTPTRTYYERIEPLNPAFFLFGDSARFKIIRAVQLHNCEPPVDASTHEWIPFFQFLSTGVEDHWQVQQQYSSCKWACGQDEELAASQLLHYGWVPKYNVKMGAPCLYKMRKQSWGISIDTQCPHLFNDRLTAACLAATQAKAKFETNNTKPTHGDLFKIACQVFFSFQGWYVSINSSLRQTVLNKIQSYIVHLLNPMGNDAVLPEIENPEDLFSQEDFIQLKWEDFGFTGISEAKQQQLTDIAAKKCYDSLQANWPFGDREATASELRPIMSGQKLKAAIKYGFLTSRREGHKVLYRLNIERSDD